MIQRIQTLFLAIATIVMAILLFMPIGVIYVNYMIDNVSMSYTYDAFFLREQTPDAPIVYSCAYLGILIALSAIMTMVTIFLYKNRIRQLRWTTFNMYMYLIVLVLMIYLFPDFIFKKIFPGAITSFQYNYWIIISLIPAALLFFARKYIQKDEKKVREMNRLR